MDTKLKRNKQINHSQQQVERWNIRFLLAKFEHTVGIKVSLDNKSKEGRKKGIASLIILAEKSTLPQLR